MKALFICLFIVLSYSGNLHAQEIKYTLTDEEKLYGLSLYWKEAAYNFAYFDHVPQLNWDSAYTAFIPQVLAARDMYEYYKTLQRFAALLKDGHTSVRLPSYLTKDSLRYPPVVFRYIEDKVIISNISREFSPQAPPGSEVLEVDSIPVEIYLKENILPYTFASTRHDFMNKAMWWLAQGRINTEIQLRIRTPAGEESILNMVRNRSATVDWAVPVAYTPVLEHKKLENGIDYIALNTFNNDSVVTRFKEILPELYSSKGIIIDIRKNGRGNGAYASAILKYFTEQKSFLGASWRTRELLSSYKAWGSFEKADEKYKKHAEGTAWYIDSNNIVENDVTGKKLKQPLAVLIGNFTFSAAEDFLIYLSSIKDREAVLIGDKTGGSTGQPLMFKLPGDGWAAICTKRDTYPDGTDFVGYGIKPGITITETVDDFINSRDPVLEKGIEIISSQIK